MFREEQVLHHNMTTSGQGLQVVICCKGHTKPINLVPVLTHRDVYLLQEKQRKLLANIHQYQTVVEEQQQRIDELREAVLDPWDDYEEYRAILDRKRARTMKKAMEEAQAMQHENLEPLFKDSHAEFFAGPLALPFE